MLRVCLLAECSMPVGNDHNNKAHALAPLDSPVSHVRVSVVSSIIFAHHEAISKQTPPPGLSHHARPPRDRPTARPTTHRWALWTLHITGRTRTTKHSTAQLSTAQHSTQARPTRGWGRGRRPSGPQQRRMRCHHGVLQPHHKQGPAPPAALRRGPFKLTFLRPAHKALLAPCCWPLLSSPHPLSHLASVADSSPLAQSPPVPSKGKKEQHPLAPLPVLFC